MKLTIRNIVEASGGRYVGDESLLDKEVTGAVIDSRLVEEGNLFIPIKGERVDGHKFIPDVFAKGALVVLSENELTDPAGPYVLVDSCEAAMKEIAAFYRRNLDIMVVGITGSVGKTSTKEMVAQVLAEKYNVHKTEGNFNNEIGLPLTIFKIRDEHQVAVLEMGISDFGEMTRLAKMANPDVMVITNIGYCHLEFLRDRDGVLEAKTEAFKYLKEGGVAVLNGDDDKLATKTEVNGRPSIFYGIGKSKTIHASHINDHGFDGIQAYISTIEGGFEATIQIPGEHNVYNAMAATAVGIELGLTLDEIQHGIEKAQTIAGRTNLIKVNGLTVIDDCYNANPVSMKAALSVLAKAPGRSIAVLGDMGELGPDELDLHREVGLAVGENHIDALFCSGRLAMQYAKAAAEVDKGCRISYGETKESMIEKLMAYVEPGDTILVKASHFMEYQSVVEALTEDKK